MIFFNVLITITWYFVRNLGYLGTFSSVMLAAIGCLVLTLRSVSKCIIAVFKCCADVGRGSDKGKKNVLPFWISCESWRVCENCCLCNDSFLSSVEKLEIDRLGFIA